MDKLLKPQVDDVQVALGPLNFNVTLLCLHVRHLGFDLFRPFVDMLFLLGPPEGLPE